MSGSHTPETPEGPGHLPASARYRTWDIRYDCSPRAGQARRAFSFSRQVGMNPYQGEGFRDVGGVATQGSGDVGVASPAHQGAGQVAKSCHHPRSWPRAGFGGVAGPYLGAVFVKGDVPYPMHPVLDVPMLPENPQQPLCPSSSRSHTGHRITHRCLCPSFHRPLPLYPAYLSQVRPPLPHRPGAARVAV